MGNSLHPAFDPLDPDDTKVGLHFAFEIETVEMVDRRIKAERLFFYTARYGDCVF
jgi:hypothetical protein